MGMCGRLSRQLKGSVDALMIPSFPFPRSASVFLLFPNVLPLLVLVNTVAKVKFSGCCSTQDPEGRFFIASELVVVPFAEQQPRVTAEQVD